MKTHHIKLLKEFADDVLNGLKTFEIRKNDRDYQKGDHVIFEIIESDKETFSKHPLNGKEYEITYILSGWGLKDGWVALGLKEEEKS